MDIERIYSHACKNWDTVYANLNDYISDDPIKPYSVDINLTMDVFREKAEFLENFYKQFGILCKWDKTLRIGSRQCSLYFDEEDLKKLITYCKLR